MNNKLKFVQEAGKLAAYAFVTLGLIGTAIAQAGVVNTAFKAASATTKK